MTNLKIFLQMTTKQGIKVRSIKSVVADKFPDELKQQELLKKHGEFLKKELTEGEKECFLYYAARLVEAGDTELQNLSIQDFQDYYQLCYETQTDLNDHSVIKAAQNLIAKYQNSTDSMRSGLAKLLEEQPLRNISLKMSEIMDSLTIATRDNLMEQVKHLEKRQFINESGKRAMLEELTNAMEVAPLHSAQAYFFRIGVDLIVINKKTVTIERGTMMKAATVELDQAITFAAMAKTEEERENGIADIERKQHRTVLYGGYYLDMKVILTMINDRAKYL